MLNLSSRLLLLLLLMMMMLLLSARSSRALFIETLPGLQQISHLAAQIHKNKALLQQNNGAMFLKRDHLSTWRLCYRMEGGTDLTSKDQSVLFLYAAQFHLHCCRLNLFQWSGIKSSYILPGFRRFLALFHCVGTITQSASSPSQLACY